MDSSPNFDEAGVSPVVGVLLMIAVTMVIGGVMFIIATGIEGSDEPPPLVQFIRSNQDGQLKVVRLERNVDLAFVDVKMSRDGFLAYNEDASTSAIEAPANQYVSISDVEGTELRAGDFLEFCLDGPQQTIEVTVRISDPPDIVIYENSFTGVRPCSA